jgi:hypothetical protein
VSSRARGDRQSLRTQVETLIAQLLGGLLECVDQLILGMLKRYVGVLRLDYDYEIDPCVEHEGGHVHSHDLAFRRDLGCIEAPSSGWPSIMRLSLLLWRDRSARLASADRCFRTQDR